MSCIYTSFDSSGPEGIAKFKKKSFFGHPNLHLIKSDCQIRLDSTHLLMLMSSPWNKGIQVKRVRYILYVSKDFFKQCELLVVAISELIDQTKCDVLKCVVLYHHKQINQGKAVVYKPFSFFPEREENEFNNVNTTQPSGAYY